AFGVAATRLSREARSSFRSPSLATEIGSPPIHGPLPRFPLAVEPPNQYLSPPPLRQRQEHSTVIPARRHPCESRDPERSRAIPAFAGMTVGAPQLTARRTTARASASMAVAMTLAGPALTGLDGTQAIRGIALHPPWKGRDGLRAGSRVSRGCGCFSDPSDKRTQALHDPSAQVARRASFAQALSNPLLLGWKGPARTALGGQQSQQQQIKRAIACKPSPASRSPPNRATQSPHPAPSTTHPRSSRSTTPDTPAPSPHRSHPSDKTRS